MVVFGGFVEATRGLMLKDGVVAAGLRTTTSSSIAPNETQFARDCLRACRDAQAACLETAGYSVRMKGYYAEIGHLRLLEDCAKLCEVSIDFLLRGSEMQISVLGLCADVCRRCASDCERFDYDQRLLACAAACERCAEVCRPLAA